MVALAIGKSQRSTKPELRITGKLAPGLHRFALEVVAADGRRSIQNVVIVEVVAAPPRRRYSTPRRIGERT